MSVQSEWWTHPYVRCSTCGGRAIATDTVTPAGPQRTVRCMECDAPTVTYSRSPESETERLRRRIGAPEFTEP